MNNDNETLARLRRIETRICKLCEHLEVDTTLRPEDRQRIDHDGDELTRLRRIETQLWRLCISEGVEPPPSKAGPQVTIDSGTVSVSIPGFDVLLSDITGALQRHGYIHSPVTFDLRVAGQVKGLVTLAGTTSA